MTSLSTLTTTAKSIRLKIVIARMAAKMGRDVRGALGEVC